MNYSVKAQNILAGWSIQESQAAVGTPALLALSGPIGATLRAATASGGAYQFGTGVGQLIEGDDTWAAAGNMASWCIGDVCGRIQAGRGRKL